MRLDENERSEFETLVELVSPKFQKRSALKFVGRTIPPVAEDIEDIRGIPEA
jgi:hypothetical protein